MRIIFVILFITTFITTSALGGRGGFWKTYQYLDGLSDNRVYAIHQDRDGNIWFGTLNGGLSKFDGRCFQTINSKDGLVSDIVRSIYDIITEKEGIINEQ